MSKTVTLALSLIFSLSANAALFDSIESVDTLKNAQPSTNRAPAGEKKPVVAEDEIEVSEQKPDQDSKKK